MLPSAELVRPLDECVALGVRFPSGGRAPLFLEASSESDRILCHTALLCGSEAATRPFGFYFEPSSPCGRRVDKSDNHTFLFLFVKT